MDDFSISTDFTDHIEANRLHSPRSRPPPSASEPTTLMADSSYTALTSGFDHSKPRFALKPSLRLKVVVTWNAGPYARGAPWAPRTRSRTSFTPRRPRWRAPSSPGLDSRRCSPGRRCSRRWRWPSRPPRRRTAPRDVGAVKRAVPPASCRSSGRQHDPISHLCLRRWRATARRER